MPAWCQSASARVTLPPLDQAAEPPTELHTTAPLGQSLRSQPTATVPRFFSSNRPVILDVPRLDAEPGAPAEPPGPSAPAGSPPAR